MLIGHADMFRAKPSQFFAMFFRYNLLPSLAFLLVWGITTTQWRSRQPCTKHNVFRGVRFPTCYGRTADNSHVASDWLHPSKTQCFTSRRMVIPMKSCWAGNSKRPRPVISARLRCILHVDVDTPSGALMLFQVGPHSSRCGPRPLSSKSRWRSSVTFGPVSLARPSCCAGMPFCRGRFDSFGHRCAACCASGALVAGALPRIEVRKWPPFVVRGTAGAGHSRGQAPTVATQSLKCSYRKRGQTYPELTCARWCWVVVVGVEGRAHSGAEAAHLLRLLACCRAATIAAALTGVVRAASEEAEPDLHKLLLTRGRRARDQRHYLAERSAGGIKKNTI